MFAVCKYVLGDLVLHNQLTRVGSRYVRLRRSDCHTVTSVDSGQAQKEQCLSIVLIQLSSKRSESALQQICYSCSTVPQIYGSKQTKSEGVG